MSRLTEEQASFANHDGGVFAHACPGAGKTSTIVARLVKISADLPPRRGIAVLSFTNSAVDEFRKRCRAGMVEALLRHPSFMGTLDSFVRQFVVQPSCTSTSSSRPIIVDSWERLGIEIRLAGQFAFRGDAVSLDLFDPNTNAIDPGVIGHAGLQNHVRLHQARYQLAAANRRRGLLQAGYLSAADARMEMLRVIGDPARSAALGCALAARFHEVIVDEGQDCNPLDLQILSWLRNYGVNVTLVCDPDQAIYGFRHGNPDGLQAFRATYPVENQRGLSGNFRSSPPICRLAATLKNVNQTDEAVGESADVTHPILLLSYDGQRPGATIGRAFLEEIAAHGLSPAGAIVLAHAGKTALRAAGDIASRDSNGTSKVESLARMVSEFWSIAATSRARESVVLSVETLLLDFMGLRLPGEHLSRAFDRAGRDRRTHRRLALSLLMSIPRICEDDDANRLAWITCVHTAIERLGIPPSPGQTIRGYFRRPPNGQWATHLQAPIELGLTCAKIHEAKGHEYDSVCVVIPPNRGPRNHSELLFQHWENRTEDEGKRVIYVGVTRARKLCALAIPIALSNRCAAVLAAGNVPHRRVAVAIE